MNGQRRPELATMNERAREMTKRRLTLIFPILLTLLLVSVATWAQEEPAPFSEDVVIFATNSAWLKQNSDVLSGDVVVNEVSPGPTLASQRELTLGLGITTPEGYLIAADSIKRKSSAVIGGDVFCNDGSGVTCNGLALPVLVPPPFNAAPPRDGAPDVFVPSGGFEVLEPGDYGIIDINQNGTVLFTGGVYNVRAIDSGIGTQLLFGGASQVRVEGKFDLRQNGFIGPDAGAQIDASDIVVYVAGINGNNGKLRATPKAARNGLSSEVHANFYVPNGTIWLRQNSDSTGAFLARDVILGIGATATLDSAFGNQPPMADPQNVATSGGDPLDLTLTGSDPEGGDLTFAVPAGSEPTEGTLGPIAPIVPDPITDPGTGDTSQPPIVSATVTYTPGTADDLEDSFTFTVTDPEGAIGAAVVQINPPTDVNPPPPPLDTVVANTGGVETQTNASVDIRLSAGAPDGVSLTYSVLTLPALGTLTDSEGGNIENVPATLPSPSLTYTASETSGIDSFDFEACGVINTVLTCDTATFLVTVQDPPPLAEDQMVGTTVNTPVDITLSGNAGGTPAKTWTITISGKAAFLDLAKMAGNVSDADGNGLGDGRDPLPGGAPVFMAAGVDVNLGGPSGSVTDPDNDATASSTSNPAPGPDVISATVTSDGVNLHLSVRYAPGTFDSTLTRTQFMLDTDEDPNTGHPGTNSGCIDDAGIIGSEFLVNVGANLGTDAQVYSYNGTCNSFSSVGTGTASYVTDGMDATVPLSLLGSDDGAMAFKVAISEQISGSTGFTGVLDYMPDLGLAAGSTGSSSAVQGIARMQIEWDVSAFKSLAGELESAHVIIDTHRGTVDSLDTEFFVGTGEQDGILSESDYEAPAVVLPNVVMPVPPGMSVGDDGTFAFDVTSQLRTVLTGDTITVFSIQGRVDENLAGQGFQRGLEVRTTADSNLGGFEPKLSITTPGVTAPSVFFTVTSLPLYGELKDFQGNLITQVPTSLTNPMVTYTPNQGITGPDSFEFEASDGFNIGSGVISIVVVDFCSEVGREPGCSPGLN